MPDLVGFKGEIRYLDDGGVLFARPQFQFIGHLAIDLYKEASLSAVQERTDLASAQDEVVLDADSFWSLVTGEVQGQAQGDLAARSVGERESCHAHAAEIRGRRRT